MSDYASASLPTKIIGATAGGVETNFAAVDAQQGQIVAGEGTAGTPVGGVLTTQCAVNGIQVSYYATNVSGTFTSTGNSGAFDSNGLSSVAAILNVTASSGTNRSLDVELQESNDQSNWSPVATFGRITTTGIQEVFDNAISSRYFRYVYTIAGSTPSFTFSVITTIKATDGNVISMKRYSDIVLQTSGSVSTTFDSKLFSTVSVQAVRTDALANANVQFDASNDGTNWDAVTANAALNGNTSFIQNFTALGNRYYRMRSATNINTGTPVVNIFWRALL